MARMKNARFDGERDADRSPACESGWDRGPPARHSFEAGPDKVQINV
jgi:hypothetical protein